MVSSVKGRSFKISIIKQSKSNQTYLVILEYIFLVYYVISLQ